jgi:hypothetical protein
MPPSPHNPGPLAGSLLLAIDSQPQPCKPRTPGLNDPCTYSHQQQLYLITATLSEQSYTLLPCHPHARDPTYAWWKHAAVKHAHNFGLAAFHVSTHSHAAPTEQASMRISYCQSRQQPASVASAHKAVLGGNNNVQPTDAQVFNTPHIASDETVQGHARHASSCTHVGRQVPVQQLQVVERPSAQATGKGGRRERSHSLHTCAA